MDVLKNKFNIITHQWVSDYIDELYEPFRIYGKLDDLLKNVPKHAYNTKDYSGQLINWKKEGDNSYIIFNPKKDEHDKINSFRDFEHQRGKLIDLMKLQIDWHNRSLTKQEAHRIEIKIDSIIDEIFNTTDTVEDYQITNQSITFNKYSANYVFSKNQEVNISKTKLAIERGSIANENEGYKFTYNYVIDHEINEALKRNYRVFNKNNNNYRVIFFDNLGRFELFKIKNKEYFIEKNENKKGRISITVHNYQYTKKWLEFLDGLKGNYCFGELKKIKDTVLEDASTKKIVNVNKITQSLEKIFFHCLDYHNNTAFESANHKSDRYTILLHIQSIWSWKQSKDKDVNLSFGELLKSLEDLFISITPYNFLQIRDFTMLWISKCIDITIEHKFQWSYSPFIDEVFNLDKKIVQLYSDERINLKNDLFKRKSNLITKKKQNKKNGYSLSQIAIAYYFLKITINKDNYLEIITKHTIYKSDKILQKLITKTNQLTSLSENKTADKKRLNNLKEAKRFISGINNNKAEKDIDQVISTFEANYNNYYY